MKKLNVSLIMQEEGSVDCGPTCVRMILDYYGINRNLEELQSKLNYSKEGTSIYDNGSILLHEGFNVNVVTAQPLLFPPDVIKNLKTQKDILELVKRAGTEKPKQKNILETFENYLEKGGIVTLEIPKFEHIKKAIDEGNPVIALMYAQTLGSNEGTYHFVVVSGYRNHEVFLNNPWPLSKKQGWFDFDKFIYGVYASTCVAVDNGTFLIASPKKN